MALICTSAILLMKLVPRYFCFNKACKLKFRRKLKVLSTPIDALRHYWFPFKWWWTTNRRMNNDSWFRDAIIQVYKVLFKCNFFQVEGRGSDSCCTHANPLMQDGGLIKADSCDLTAASLVWICMCLGNGVVMSTSMMKGCRAISV